MLLKHCRKISTLNYLSHGIYLVSEISKPFTFSIKIYDGAFGNL